MNQVIQGVKAIIRSANCEDKYLLAQHKFTDINNKGKWTFLGGRVDESDKSYEATLLRELNEELNLTVIIEKELGIFEYKNKNRIYLVFLATATNIPVICSDEIIKIAWFSYSEIEYMHKSNLLQTGFETQAFKIMIDEQHV